MKTIYKSLMTIAFAGLCLASCDKELKEDTAMEVGVVTDSNVSFDGKTVTGRNLSARKIFPKQPKLLKTILAL